MNNAPPNPRPGFQRDVVLCCAGERLFCAVEISGAFIAVAYGLGTIAGTVITWATARRGRVSSVLNDTPTWETASQTAGRNILARTHVDAVQTTGADGVVWMAGYFYRSRFRMHAIIGVVLDDDALGATAVRRVVGAWSSIGGIGTLLPFNAVAVQAEAEDWDAPAGNQRYLAVVRNDVASLNPPGDYFPEGLSVDVFRYGAGDPVTLTQVVDSLVLTIDAQRAFDPQNGITATPDEVVIAWTDEGADQVVIEALGWGNTVAATAERLSLPAGVSGSDIVAEVAHLAAGQLCAFAHQSGAVDSAGHVLAWIAIRAGGVWGDWERLDDEAYSGALDRPRIATHGGPARVLVSSGAVSWDVLFNVAPFPPTWQTAAGAHDSGADLALDWDFSDPNPGDTQAHFTLERAILSGGVVTGRRWLRANGFWSGSLNNLAKIASTNSERTLATPWSSAGDDEHRYRVRVWDSAGLGPSEWSAPLSVRPVTRPAVTITAPTNNKTLRTEGTDDRMRWNLNEGQQDAYRITTTQTNTRRTIETDTGWITSASRDVQVPTDPAALTGSRYWRLQIRNSAGLESATDEVRVAYAWLLPAVPTVRFADGEAVMVIITPEAAVPQVIAPTAAADIETRVLDRAGDPHPYRPDGQTQRIAHAFPVAGRTRFADHGAPTIVESEYRVRARTFSGRLSAWTAWAG